MLWGSILKSAVLFMCQGIVSLLQEQIAALLLAARVFGLLLSTFFWAFKTYSTRLDPTAPLPHGAPSPIFPLGVLAPLYSFAGDMALQPTFLSCLCHVLPSF